MRKAMIVVALWGASAACSAAQTAEETVAYIATGLIENGYIETDTRKITMKQTSDSPLTFNVTYDPPGKDFTTVSIRRVSDCQFEFKLEGGEQPTSISYDFNKFVGAKSTKFSNELIFSGSCPVNINGQGCYTDMEGPYEFTSPPDRLAGAVKHLKENYCKGRAF